MDEAAAQVSIAPSVLCRELDGELVLLNVDQGTYFSLNPVGTRIWQLIEQFGGRLQPVAESVLEEFDVSQEQCRRDLAAWVQTLCEHRLLEPKKPSAA